MRQSILTLLPRILSIPAVLVPNALRFRCLHVNTLRDTFRFPGTRFPHNQTAQEYI